MYPAVADDADWTIDTSHSHVRLEMRHMSASWARGNFSALSGGLVEANQEA